MVKSLDRKTLKNKHRTTSPAPSALSEALVAASKSSSDVPVSSRQGEKKQLQGLNSRLAGIIDKVHSPQI